MKKKISFEDRKRDYIRRFLKEANIAARFGKTTYVRKEYHERIKRIVRIIGNDEVSLFSYIDNVLEQHFSCCQDEITELFSKNRDLI